MHTSRSECRCSEFRFGDCCELPASRWQSPQSFLVWFDLRRLLVSSLSLINYVEANVSFVYTPKPENPEAIEDNACQKIHQW